MVFGFLGYFSGNISFRSGNKFFVAKGVVQVECPVRQLVRNGCRVRVAVDKAAPVLQGHVAAVVALQVAPLHVFHKKEVKRIFLHVAKGFERQLLVGVIDLDNVAAAVRHVPVGDARFKLLALPAKVFYRIINKISIDY